MEGFAGGIAMEGFAGGVALLALVEGLRAVLACFGVVGEINRGNYAG